jgi:pyrimidine operon attenuation protein/uracil phosphoribosyltransferase
MKTLILNNQQIQQKINRMAYEIYESNYDAKKLVLAGIADRGYTLATKLKKALNEICAIEIELLEVFVTRENPIEEKTKTQLNTSNLSNNIIIVVDDVLNSGKTLIYGVKHFLSMPIKKISTVVLVDRNHKRFPIQADYVGLSLATTMQEHINVEFEEGNDSVFLV